MQNSDSAADAFLFTRHFFFFTFEFTKNTRNAPTLQVRRQKLARWTLFLYEHIDKPRDRLYHFSVMARECKRFTAGKIQ